MQASMAMVTEEIPTEKNAPIIEPSKGVEEPLSLGIKRSIDAVGSAEHTETKEPPLCEMCSMNSPIYKCPRCNYLTCSLKCCVGHKKKFDCDGQRDRTKFISLSKFKDSELLSDYFFLEEVSKFTETGPRKRVQIGAKTMHAPKLSHKKRKMMAQEQSANTHKYAALNPDFPKDWMSRFPVSIQRVVQKAASYGVRLNLMAPGMSKRKKNTTRYHRKEDLLEWRVEWRFINSGTTNLVKVDERVVDTTTLRTILQQHIEGGIQNAFFRSQIKNYLSDECGLESFVLLLRKEGSSNRHGEYYRLDITKSLRTNLSGKLIIEYPEIYVVLPTELDKYNIVHNRIEELDGGEICEVQVALNDIISQVEASCMHKSNT